MSEEQQLDTLVIITVLFMLLTMVVTHPSEEIESKFEEPEGRREDPHVDDGDESEDDRPDQGRRDGDDGGQQAVQPELGLREHDEGQAPDAVEALRAVRLRQDVVEAELREERRDERRCPRRA